MSDGAAPAGNTGGQGGATAANGGAPASSTGAAGTPATGTQAGSDWTTGIANEELRSYAQTKGWKDVASLTDSYRQYEKLQGVPQERLLRLPDKPEDPAWADINTKLGVPKEAKEYQFEVPKEFGDEEFSNKAKEWFHKNGVPKAKAEAIVKNWNEYVAGKMNEDRQSYQADIAKQTEGLKKEWGAAFDQNVKMGKMAALAFGFDEGTINKLESSMGFAGVMKFMHNLQTKIGEDKFVGSNQNNSSFGNIMTPEQAKSQIKLRQQDVEFKNRLVKKDAIAMEEWTSLHKMAFPEPS